jgi:hypothetical protein
VDHEDAILQKCIAISGWNYLQGKFTLRGDYQNVQYASQIIRKIMRELKGLFLKGDI